MHSDQLVGRQVDAFTIEERIGKGGMATVYRAYQPSINRSVALKIITLDPAMGERDEFRQRFAQEAQTIAALEHIHILPIYDYGIVNDEIAYIAMRLLRGGSLADMLTEGALDIQRTADIFTQIARGLQYAHSKGVIHRDLKPSNILFDESDNAYLTDFGLAKMVANSMNLTESGNIVGTPAYMSPEQLRGDAIDHRCDIYGLGCILYHMLVGRPPFEASESNVVSVIYQHLEKEPEPPTQTNPNIPPEVEKVALRALNKDPDDRYDSAEEMANALNAALGRSLNTTSYPLVHVTKRSPIKRPAMTRRTYSALGIGFALMTLLLILILQMRPPNRPPTVLADQSDVMSSAAPTTDEIIQAQAALGGDGFVAYITCNQTSQYHAAIAREIVDAAGIFGLLARIYDSDSKKDLEISQIERARADGASGLIVCPLDIAALNETLTSVDEAGIPLVLMTSDSPSFGGVLISGDDYLVGLEAGRAAGRIIRDEMGGQAQVIILDYPDLEYLVTRANGLQNGVLEIAPDAEIVGRFLGGTSENGEQSVNQLISESIMFNVILSINDAGSYGAIAAMESAGFSHDSVIISSVDAESVARQYISEGYFMRASVDVPRLFFAQTAVNAMVKLLAGATLPETYLVPPGQPITRENLATAELEATTETPES